MDEKVFDFLARIKLEYELFLLKANRMTITKVSETVSTELNRKEKELLDWIKMQFADNYEPSLENVIVLFGTTINLNNLVKKGLITVEIKEVNPSAYDIYD